jgi:hypothetical protein
MRVTAIFAGMVAAATCSTGTLETALITAIAERVRR